MNRRNWEYRVECQDCGLTEMSKNRDVYRCRFCGSKDVDVTSNNVEPEFFGDVVKDGVQK